MSMYGRKPSPLTATECGELERLIARGVAGADASGAENLPGWVYAGASAEYGVTLLCVALRTNEPLADVFIQGVLSRVCHLAETLYNARTTETEAPRARSR